MHIQAAGHSHSEDIPQEYLAGIICLRAENLWQFSVVCVSNGFRWAMWHGLEWCNQEELPATRNLQPTAARAAPTAAATAYKIIDFVHILDTNKHSLGSGRVELAMLGVVMLCKNCGLNPHKAKGFLIEFEGFLQLQMQFAAAVAVVTAKSWMNPLKYCTNIWSVCLNCKTKKNTQ